GGDVNVIAKGIGLDKRISPLFLKAGLGFGGSCFPKDVKAFIQFSKKIGYHPPLAEATMRINFDQPLWAVEMAEEKLGDLRGKKIALLGLAFKPDTDDMREAVSIRIVEELLKRGAKVSAHDPEAIDVATSIFEGKVSLERDVRKCLDAAECAILVTEWKDYAKLQPQDFKKMMKRAFVIDGRRLFDKEKFSKNLKFAAIGLGSI
ncbi:MAG: UDP-glucose/GDP-mannose dehydrogenase family protein, partial [Thaumarchaeota archaeon]|nr:UDP-glucose/GDP-mannose dehydrogenase family protein [Nitrososphaerota archaeon]